MCVSNSIEIISLEAASDVRTAEQKYYPRNMEKSRMNYPITFTRKMTKGFFIDLNPQPAVHVGVTLESNSIISNGTVGPFVKCC